MQGPAGHWWGLVSPVAETGCSGAEAATTYVAFNAIRTRYQGAPTVVLGHAAALSKTSQLPAPVAMGGVPTLEGTAKLASAESWTT